MMRKPLKVEKQVIEFTRRQAPTSRKIIKEGIKQLAYGLGDIKPLEGKLSGFYRLRLNRVRVIFCYDSHTICCLFIEHRSIVYSIFEDILTSHMLS